MARLLPPKIVSDIKSTIAASERDGQLLRVYAEAERIRQANLDENIALEDIVEELLFRSVSCCAGLELDVLDSAQAIFGHARILH